MTIRTVSMIAGATALLATAKAPREVSAASSVAARPESTFVQSLPASAGQRIEIDLDPGGFVDVIAWDEPRVEVRGLLGGRDWRDTRVSFERTSDGVRLRAKQIDRYGEGSSTSHRFVLRVPRKFDIRLHSSGGGLNVNGVSGRFTGNTGGGDLVFVNANGYSSLSTGGGEIRITDSHLDGTMSTGGGQVLLSGLSGSLRPSSGSGPIVWAEDRNGRGVSLDVSNGKTVTIHELGGVRGGRYSTSGRLHMDKSGGAISIDAAPNGADLNTGGGEISVGPSGGRLSVSTGGGDIDIGPARGSVDATTGAGNIDVELAPAEEARREVEIASGNGRIMITLPSSFAGRLDLETGYTRSHRPTTVRGDVALDVRESSDWDSSQGTPRKLVRATATIGRGSEIIRVRTTNGDIVVRSAR